jgi:hypothetical protein
MPTAAGATRPASTAEASSGLIGHVAHSLYRGDSLPVEARDEHVLFEAIFDIKRGVDLLVSLLLEDDDEEEDEP